MAAFDKRALYGVAARYVAGLDSKLEVFGVRDKDVDAGKVKAGGSIVDSNKSGLQPKTRPANEEKYQALHPVWGISVLTQDYFINDSDAYRCFTLYDKAYECGYGHDGIDLMRLAFLEIAKKVDGQNANLLYWAQFLTGKALDGAAPDYIKQASAIVDRHNLSSEEVAMLTAQQLYQLDIDARIDYALEDGWNRGLEQGLEQGLERGLEQGLERGTRTIAKNALDQGASLDFFQAITGMDLEALKKLQEN
jgi:predicted transposase/invertase (TIGR01784 family)